MMLSAEAVQAAEETLKLSYEIGIISGISFVIGFGLLNFGVLKSTSPLYQTFNLVGALGFTYTAILPFNPGLFITESVWALVALFGLWKIWKGKTVKGDPKKPKTADAA